MKTLRRFDIRDRIYFITSVTDNRQELLLRNIDIFWRSWDKMELNAWVVLPEHFHIMLEIKDKGISEIMHGFKRRYSIRFLNAFMTAKVWQNRFYDHIIRDEADYFKHLNYIHYNPVKHGLVKSPFDYPYSSIHKFKDYYEPDWGMKEDELKGDYGE